MITRIKDTLFQLKKKQETERRTHRERYIHIIIRHETQGGLLEPTDLCQTASAIRAEAAGVALKPLPLRRSAAAVCLPHLKDSISMSRGGKKKK